jgi:hypothetical protein
VQVKVRPPVGYLSQCWQILRKSHAAFPHWGRLLL